jgi:hypothetical protein
MTKEEQSQQIKNDLAFLMSTVSGRRTFARILRLGGMWRSSITEKREATDFNEGMRALALVIYGELEKNCFDQLLILLKETHRDVQIIAEANRKSKPVDGGFE